MIIRILPTYVRPPIQRPKLLYRAYFSLIILKCYVFLFFFLPGVIAANMAWKIMNAEAGMVCPSTAGSMPTPLNKKCAIQSYK